MVRAAGDCTVSLGLLERLPAGADLRILGSTLTRSVAAAIGFDRFPIDIVTPDVAALFDLRKAGPRRALADLIRIRRALARPEHAGSTLLLEHADWRNRWLAPARARLHAVAPGRTQSVYADRHRLLQQVFGAQPPLEPAARPRHVSRVLLNPGSRVARKALPPAIVAAVAAWCRKRRLPLCLLDPECRHASAADQVASYRAGPSLAQSLAELRATDFYIGADSFFLHLAYRYRRPAFAIVPEPDPYFALPGAASDSILTFDGARGEHSVEVALDRFCVA